MNDYCTEDEYFTNNGFRCFCDGGFIVTFIGTLAALNPNGFDE